jgi:hypothetical protein
VKGADWWRAALEEHFHIKKEALIGEDLYYTAQVEKKIT